MTDHDYVTVHSDRRATPEYLRRKQDRVESADVRVLGTGRWEDEHKARLFDLLLDLSDQVYDRSSLFKVAEDIHHRKHGPGDLFFAVTHQGVLLSNDRSEAEQFLRERRLPDVQLADLFVINVRSEERTWRAYVSTDTTWENFATEPVNDWHNETRVDTQPLRRRPGE